MSHNTFNQHTFMDGRLWIRNERGMALVTTLLVTTLLTALMAGFLAAVVADQRASGIERDQTQAYAAAHAGLEQLTSDLAGLFTRDFSPSGAQVNQVATRVPTIPGFSFTDPLTGGSGYQITFTPDATPGPNFGNPAPESAAGSTITAGPFENFRGIITPYSLTVTAQSASGGAEVRLRRTLQTVSIPVFQFGVFSENDLAFNAGDNFNFGGLVHTNSNLFVAHAAGGTTLTLSDRITAREIIRRRLMNGVDTNAGTWSGTVSVTRGSGQFRNLATNEGSVTTGPGSPANEPSWTPLSRTTYRGNIKSQTTGWRQLNLPIAQDGATPIDLIRRPPAVEDPAGLIFPQRYFSKASIRIVLSDTAADITNLPTVTPDAPVELGVLGGWPVATGVYPAPWEHSQAGLVNERPLAPFAATGNFGAMSGTLPAGTYLSGTDYQPLLGGFLKIEIRRNDGTWLDVTREVMMFGYTGRNLSNGVLHTPSNAANNTCAELYANSIVRVQRVRDDPIDANHGQCGIRGIAGLPPAQQVPQNPIGITVSPDPRDYWPNVLYDTREGNIRDVGNNTATMALGGLVHYIELDVRNLRQWLAGVIPGQGNTVAVSEDGNGYILYFSDRRGNRNAANQETGEYGYEDNINPATAAGNANGVLDDDPANPRVWLGEDANGDEVFDIYGATPRNNYPVPQGQYAGAPTPRTQIVPASGAIADLRVAAARARVNRPLFFRRALKLVNGAIVGGVSNLPAGGFTIASENPVYVQGDFNALNNNANAAGNVPAAIVSDAVTVLSNGWNDIRSFTSPNDPTNVGALAVPFTQGRVPTNTGYRFAVVAGKTPAFPRNAWAADAAALWGTDGGANNFLRLLESWGNASIFYRGSIVSLFFSRQATGAFKCCTTVYNFGPRNYSFDTAFLLPAQLPPGTPMFRDVNTLTFRQLLRPTQ